MTHPVGGDGAQVWAALEAAWERAQTVVVVGPAGIGKRRLVQEFADSKGESLTVDGLALDRAVPYATKARALRRLLRERPELAPEGWQRFELSRLLPDLFEAPAWQEPVRDDLGGLRLVEAASAVLAKALEAKTSIVTIDLHFWDDASFAAIRQFLSQFASSRIHALASFDAADGKPGRHRELAALAESGLAQIVTLQPLDVARVWRLAADATGDTAGRTAPGTTQPGEAGDLWALSRAAPVPRGSGAASLLESWVDGLSPEAVGVLCLRALTGDAYTPELAGATLALPADVITAASRELERHGLVTEATPVHALVAAAALRRAPQEPLRVWRGRLAETLERVGAHPALTASHYLGAWRPDDAFPHLMRAGEAAAGLYAVADARRWFLRALWAAPDRHARAYALLALYDAAMTDVPVAFTEAVENELAQLCRALDDPGITLECELRRTRRLTWGGEPERARQAAEAALELARDDVAARNRATLALADVAHLTRRYDEARERLRSVARASDGRLRLEAVQRLAWLEEATGNLATALEENRRALRLARELGALPSVARLLTRVGANEERLGVYDGSIRSLLEAAEVASQTGDRQVEGIALADAAISFADTARLARAYRAAARAMEVTEPLGMDRSSALAHFVQGYVLRRLGRWREARADLTEALRYREAVGDPRGALVARFNLAAIELERAQADGVPADHGLALDAIAGLEAMHVDEFVAWCRLELAFLTPDAAAARDYVDRAAAVADSERMALAADAARLRAALLEGDAEAIAAHSATLARRTSGAPWLETSLAHLLLARAAGSESASRRHRLRALRRIVAEVGDLDPDASRSRLRYLEGRLPPVGRADRGRRR